ncbi:MAG: competence protein ComEC [Proteobacteria bacterium SG_bin9]|nr:MAG: competence protein ComEC [Proteobacteria bacterium SG_bin9]
MAERGNSRAKVQTWGPRAAERPDDGARQFVGGVRGVLEQLRTFAVAEASQAQLLPWAAIAFGAGIALYFGVSREPVFAVVAPLAALLAIVAFLARRRNMFPLLLLLAVFAVGFAMATWKTVRVGHTVLTRPLFGVSLKGFVETREERERTDRFILRVVEMTHERNPDKLERVRLSVKKGTAPAVGQFVELKARLQPPLAPLRPGGYDFARDLYFQGVGASGFVTGAVRSLQPPASVGIWLSYAAFMQGLRDGIDARIKSVLSGDHRAIATALLTGKRDAISSPVNDAMFISGLGHVLSISGYHMAVVAGVVFFAVRALLALIPSLTPAFPIKKWAALAALVAALFYLLLSGAEVATQRSFLMTAVVLVAIMVDRRAITFRTLAIAALVVLALAPESVVHPSFQMSFAATLGLVALVERGMPILLATPDNSSVAHAALWGGREIAALALASIIAGLATLPFAAFHFHRITPYGVLANLAAMPVVSGIVMPAGLLGLVAIPFGLDGVFWRIMEVGIGWMIAVSQWVAALPGAVGRVIAFGAAPLLFATLGILLISLLRTPLRFIGAAALALAAILAATAEKPDILIAGDGESVAVRGADGRLRFMRAEKNAFQVREWLAADADARTAADKTLADGVSCDDAGCVVPMPGGALVGLALRPEALPDDCERTVLVVTAHPAPRDCASFVIDRGRLRSEGTLSLQRQGEGFSIVAVRPQSLERPWYPRTVYPRTADPRTADPRTADPGTPAASENAIPASPQRRRPAIDATPSETDIQPDD